MTRGEEFHVDRNSSCVSAPFPARCTVVTVCLPNQCTPVDLDKRLSGQKVLYAVLAANTAGPAKNMGLGQAARKMWLRLGRDEFHSTVSRSKTCGASGSRRSRSFHEGTSD